MSVWTILIVWVIVSFLAAGLFGLGATVGYRRGTEDRRLGRRRVAHEPDVVIDRSRAPARSRR